jgi:hypothetical protein
MTILEKQTDDRAGELSSLARPSAKFDGPRRDLLALGVSSVASALCGMLAVACSVDHEGTQTQQGIDGSIVPLDASKPGPGLDASALDSGVSDAAPIVEAAAPIDAAPRAPDPDSVLLNLLLTTAYELATAYGACGVLIQGAPSTDPFAAMAPVLRDITVSFQAHHKAHAQELAAAVVNLRGKPITEQEVTSNFKAPDALRSNPTISNVLKYAAQRERAAVVACNRMIGQLEASYYRYLVSAIEGVQAQHFTLWLSLLQGLTEAGPEFDPSKASKVVPTAFVRVVEKQPGLDTVPPRYFG